MAGQVVDGDVLNFKKDLAPARRPGMVQVLENFTLGIDGDAFSAGELSEVNAVAAAFKAQLDSVVNQAFAFQAFPEAHRGEQVDRPLFEDAGPDPFLNVLSAAILDHDRLDPFEIQEVRQHKTGRSRTNDAHLGTE